MLPDEHANKWSGFSPLKLICEMPETSSDVFVINSIFSRSQYFTVLSEDPFAIVSNLGLNRRQVTAWPGV